MEQRLEMIHKMLETMILEQKELSRKLLCKTDKISRTWHVKLKSSGHLVKHVEDNSRSLVQSQCPKQSDN